MPDKEKVTIVNVVQHGKFLFQYLLGKWLIIGLISLLCAILGVTYIWLKKPMYIAEMSFVTETESKNNISAYASIAAQFGIDLGAGGSSSLFEGENLIELLKSKHLIIQTLLSKINKEREALMIEQYLAIEGLADEETSKMNFEKYYQQPERKRDSIILKAAVNIRNKFLSINKRDKKLSIIDLRMFYKDEMFAKRFCELLAYNAIQYYTDYKVKKSKQNVAILERQTDSVRSMLYGNIGEMAAINDLNVNPTRQIVRTGSQRKQVDVQANSALYVELVKNLELSRLSLRKETPLIQIVDTPILPLEIKGIGRLLGGIIGGFIGAILTIVFLVLSMWYNKIKAAVNNSSKRDS